ncbi:hypothetical protein PENANT_c011G06883 [Penicillium antarcticum]|uniref:Uncharacterized protein n=1 Tax=Penicillium antarcticum TaxID=416450 RepID=A0A1V6Q783_9EURO|nr:uncharacterized protein N7508_003040 [Penicillium antarcticum]KAJ5312210.1 hypothetical protein N7508_003040 [Penicillium antarcticum]OQD84897.1 hypothetical protein PENANT_c011G06883 [Penicillium antarcticum]
MTSLIDTRLDDFGRMSDIDATGLFGAAFPSELVHLQNASPTVETTTATPIGRLGKNENETPSTVLYGENFAEVNRTVVSMLAVKWLLADDYSTFTAGQKEDGKLTENSFCRLRDFYINRLPTEEDLHTLLIAMVVDDIGKDPNLAKQLEQHTGESAGADHSQLVFKAAQMGLIPALEIVPATLKDDILGCLQIGSSLNISQVVQGECPPASLTILQHLPGQGRGFTLRAMVTFLDVAGAGGHADTRSCIVMTEPVFQGYIVAMEALDDFANGRISSPRACYDRILESRGRDLQQQNFILPSLTDEVRALLRLLCMGRVTTREQAEPFKQAFSLLSPSIKANLVNGLNVDGTDDGPAIIPYYAPGLLISALKTTADKPDEAVIPVLGAFMRFLARVFDGSKPQPGASGGIVEHDLSFVQDIIKSRGFRDNPQLLDEVVLPWKDPKQHKRSDQ